MAGYVVPSFGSWKEESALLLLGIYEHKNFAIGLSDNTCKLIRSAPLSMRYSNLETYRAVSSKEQIRLA